LITGSFFVETVYGVPGPGPLLRLQHHRARLPGHSRHRAAFGFVISVMNLIVDLLYPLLDPRIAER